MPRQQKNKVAHIFKDTSFRLKGGNWIMVKSLLFMYSDKTLPRKEPWAYIKKLEDLKIRRR